MGRVDSITYRVACSTLLFTCTVSAWAASAVPAPAGEAAGEADLLALVENVHMFSPVLSGDGQWVAYLRRHTALEANGFRYEVVLRRTDGHGQARILAESAVLPSARGGGLLSWSPADNVLAYRLPGAATLQLYRLDEGTRRELQLPDEARRVFSGFNATGLQWSPDGRRIAFAAPAASAGSPAPAEATLDTGIELDEHWDPVRMPGGEDRLRSFQYTPSALWVLDLDGAGPRQVSDPTLDVVSYRWSPDGTRLVIAAGSDLEWTRIGMSSDLHLVEVSSGRTTLLLRQRGTSLGPVWSPDGRWIAFASQFPFTSEQQPRDLNFHSTLMVVAADGASQPRDLLERYRSDETVPLAVGGIAWLADSASLRFSGSAQLRSAPYRVGLDGSGMRPLTPREPILHHTECDLDAGERIACIRQSPTLPAALVFSGDDGTTWQVLDAGSGAGPFAQLSSEVVEWRSADDRWNVRGILVKPPGFDPARRYPLVVFLNGGPGMVRGDFGISTQYPLLAWARRGFLVLAPNTRGRPGYGLAFSRAISDERSERLAPYADVISGVDALVARGVVDPERMGITGFSYGFALGVETIAQTQRFRAASLGDGVVENLTVGFIHAALPWHREVMRDQNGLGSVFDPESLALMQRESTLFRLHQVRTPVLTEFGAAHTLAATQGRMLLNVLRAQKVPVELVAYPRTGHGITEPKLRMDSMRRNLEWFDHWVLGVSSERMRARYGGD